ncbi:uncharacterized protein A4U43_C09F12500 [Asparagus officinalis]|uniref:Uncharacterized protein n=1 Tax=Asparagus officinalis TaxID=4686 RepID=A0A5P1E7I3_ASPOF|nr:uncharacterized protein A4U43_C09F12500 [Asparagus officinalis]
MVDLPRSHFFPNFVNQGFSSFFDFAKAFAQVVRDQEEAGEEDEAEQAHSPLDLYNAKRRHWRHTKLGF